MLVLSRKLRQRIIIDERIVLEVTQIGRDAIRTSVLSPVPGQPALRVRHPVIVLGEPFQLRDDVTVRLLAIGFDKVRIGIQAPRQIPVHRDEVQQRILAERREGIRAPRHRPIFTELFGAGARLVMLVCALGCIIALSGGQS